MYLVVILLVFVFGKKKRRFYKMQIYIFLIYFTVVTGATDGIGKGYTHQVYYKGRSWS
jgi:hypothetical protein